MEAPVGVPAHGEVLLLGAKSSLDRHQQPIIEEIVYLLVVDLKAGHTRSVLDPGILLHGGVDVLQALRHETRSQAAKAVRLIAAGRRRLLRLAEERVRLSRSRLSVAHDGGSIAGERRVEQRA